MKIAKLFSLEDLAKARTPGAKDKQPRKRRMESQLEGHHEVLIGSGYSKGGTTHPKAHFYHKAGNLVMVNRETGDWSHYTNEKGFTQAGSGYGTLRDYLRTKGG
jgi:hypothetical protein